MVDICLFPIPGCVTFPGTVFPLHVFEPRYRAMIQHCLETEQLVAICHTRKQVSPAKPQQSLAQKLSSNQATYRPYDVVSAGRCDLIETMDDGRLLLNVHIEARYRVQRELQTLPYQVYACELFPDRVASEAEVANNKQLQQQIMARLLTLGAEDATLLAILSDPKWSDMPPERFSYEIFGVIRFEPEWMQAILEMDHAFARLSELDQLLTQVG